jgi:proline iminopeptidase
MADPMEKSSMRTLYPAIEPYKTGHIKVSDLHEIYYEECGAPNGQPVIFVHGGPGGGIISDYRRYFDPETYRVILFDQRGCGKSTPHANLEENTTWDLVADMEQIRNLLGIEKWVVFGGSWGSTLSLAYSQTHPNRVKALVLRGIFLLRPQELRWFYQEGASFIYPDAWRHYLEPIPVDERDDMIQAYHKRLTSDDGEVRNRAARAWSVWEASTSKLFPDDTLKDMFASDDFANAFARIECHYFVNGGFLDHPDQLLQNVDTMRHIPGVIVQGRYDVVCPMTTAWELHLRWPEAEFHVIPDAGHSAGEPGIIDALVRATDRFRDLDR